MKRNWYKVNTCAYPSCAQLLNKRGTVYGKPLQVEPDRVKMPRMTITWGRCLRQINLLGIAENAFVPARIAVTDFDELLKFSELVNAYCGLEITEVVLETALVDLVEPAT